MGKKVLILGVASVQMDAVLVLKALGCETFTCAMAKDGPAADAADHFAVINILDEEAVAQYIMENRIDAVYSTGSDLAMPVACRLSERLGLPHFVSAETACICNHKELMRQTLSAECEGNIPYQVFSEIETVKVEYPAILKPSDAQGQRGVCVINSQKEFEEHFEEVKKYSRQGKVIVEKYIDGSEISVNGYMVNGQLRFLVASDRDTWPEYTGLIHRHIVPGTVITAEVYKKVRRIVQTVCNRVGILNGPVYFQMKVDNGQPYVIELTPRLDGCHMWNVLERATGVNLMKLTFSDLLLGDISELENEKDSVQPMELVFWCQEPKTYMDRSELELPEDAVYHFYYYEDGDYIRPVNGRYDKIGYYIRNLES